MQLILSLLASHVIMFCFYYFNKARYLTLPPTSFYSRTSNKHPTDIHSNLPSTLKPLLLANPSQETLQAILLLHYGPATNTAQHNTAGRSTARHSLGHTLPRGIEPPLRHFEPGLTFSNQDGPNHRHSQIEDRGSCCALRFLECLRATILYC